jgi:hypothetical protein
MHQYTARFSKKTKIPNVTEGEYTAIYARFSKKIKIPNATAGEYTAIYSKM